MTKDEQEALSRKYSNDLILLLPLESGNVAVFNTARELCGIVEIVEFPAMVGLIQTVEFPPDCWFPPKSQEALIRACADTLNDSGVTIDALKKVGLL